MKPFQVLLPVVACLVGKVSGKIFSRCELASILKRWGMDGHQGYSLADWVCLAYFASGFDSATVTNNSDGSSEYGIFQINSRSWCADQHSQTKNLCSMACLDLLTDEIIDDIICLKRASAGSSGLETWDGWRNHCHGRDLSYWVATCNL
ncbi:sperm acrosome membrane-associated protein 3-like [Sceloporus undulatus]|uniref:sperm acrosome membrane-associated protein 3-like n=1 Tax=Sceloporus undulatus TaxID=8520 RepID=UPI001C4C3040|nr:sperm acrosome membrane-associated protein 3-like [Sceloporus undulatus]